MGYKEVEASANPVWLLPLARFCVTLAGMKLQLTVLILFLLAIVVAFALVPPSVTALVKPGATTLPATTVSASAAISGCAMFPADNVWNTRIDTLPVHPRSNDYIATIGPTTGLHPDFGEDLGALAFWYSLHHRPDTQTPVTVTFDIDGESDPGPYPIPPMRRLRAAPAATVTATCWWWTVTIAFYTKCMTPGRKPGELVEGRFGRGFYADLQCLAARHLDIGRRSGIAHPARPGAL